MAEMLTRVDAPKTWVDGDGTTRIDRRRPGRAEEVDTSLVPLLRGETCVAADSRGADPVDEVVFGPLRDDLKFALGARWGLCSALVFWGGAGYLLLR